MHQHQMNSVYESKGLDDEKTKQKLTEDIKRVLDKTDLFAGIDFIEPLIFNLELKKPTDEMAIQKSLKDAGYSDEDVVSITPVNQLAKEYLVDISGLEDVKKTPTISRCSGRWFEE